MKKLGLLALVIAAACHAREPSVERQRSAPVDAATSEPIPDEAPAPPPEDPTPKIVEPDDSPASRAAHLAITTRQLGAAPEIPELGRFVALDHPEGLARFHEALNRLERGETKDHVRILIYGSSNIAGDRLPGYLRGYLQARFGDGGPGFIALAPLWRWHRHQEITLDTGKGWTAEDIRKPTPPLDARYGLMGVRARTSGRRPSLIELRGLSPRVERWSIWYEAGPERGSFELRASSPSLDAAANHVETSADAGAAGYASFESSAGIERLELRPAGDGELVLFGAVLERAEPGVVVDELGIGGSGLRRMLEWDQGLLTKHLQQRAPALIIIAAGGIESMRHDHDPERWAAELDAVFERLAAATPDADCLFVGPHDRAPKESDGARRRPAILDGVAAIAREHAIAHGCAYYDTEAAMGGPRTMPTWVAEGLAMKDHVHFTPKGNALIGRRLVDAIMAAAPRR